MLVTKQLMVVIDFHSIIKNTMVYSQHLFYRKNDEDVEDLDEDVYFRIAVTKYMLYLGFNGVRMNPEHTKPFIHFQFTTPHVN